MFTLRHWSALHVCYVVGVRIIRNARPNYYELKIIIIFTDRPVRINRASELIEEIQYFTADLYITG